MWFEYQSMYSTKQLASCVIGGVSLMGGKGSLIEGVLGVIIIGVIDSVKVLGGPGTWPDMPQGKYDLWPVLDVESYTVIDREGKEFNIVTPTAVMK